MPTVENLRTACREPWPEEQLYIKTPRPIEVNTDPDGGIRLSVPHDEAGGTATGTASSYCTTLTMTPVRWRQVIAAVQSRLPEAVEEPLGLQEYVAEEPMIPLGYAT